MPRKNNGGVYDVAIVGGGPGGYSAALYCVRAGFSTLVLEQLSPGGQMATTTQIDNYPGFDEGVDGLELAERMQRGAERFGADTVYETVTALELDAMPRRVITSRAVHSARAVILAPGASPRKLGLPGEDRLRGRGVAYCAACDGMFYRGKSVAVIGGGNSAAADALTLSKLCSQVWLVHRRDRLRAEFSYLQPLEQAKNVSFVWNSTPTGFVTEGDRLRAVTLADVNTGAVRELACDGVFVAIGRRPDTDFLPPSVARDKAGYILADETTRTSVPGVFAVGDARTKPLRQIVTAAADGAVAAHFAQEYLASLS